MAMSVGISTGPRGLGLGLGSSGSVNVAMTKSWENDNALKDP